MESITVRIRLGPLLSMPLTVKSTEPAPQCMNMVKRGIVTDPSDPNVARHHPADYLAVTRDSVRDAVAEASKQPDFDLKNIAGIAIDATASTPIPVDKEGKPLAFSDRYADDLNTYAWLWKDHSSHAEAEEISRILEEYWPQTIGKIGGTYSSEWFWSKLLRFKRLSPKAYNDTASWVEISDWLSGWLCGEEDVYKLKRGLCCAGHKGLYDEAWNGYPDRNFFEKIDPDLTRIAESIRGEVFAVGEVLGRLCKSAADYLGLPEGIIVGVPEIDAHIGALGAGIGEGSMVKIMGTSGVDLVITPNGSFNDDIPGFSGVVEDSILPGFTTIEAGQSALGDVYGWFVDIIKPDGKGHEELTCKAAELRPGETGLISLDWFNGNRTVLVDPNLSGMILGMNLRTKPEHIYRSLVEATAFGSKVILSRLSEYGVKVERIITAGGLPGRNSFVMQIFADVLECELRIPASDQTCALGAAISAKAAVDMDRTGRALIEDIISQMTTFRDIIYKPDASNFPVYRKLFGIYMQLHDAFGTDAYTAKLNNVMKDLLELRKR